MNLLQENADRFKELRQANIPDGAIADTVNCNHGTSFTADGVRQIGNFILMAEKKMLLTKVQERLFKEIAKEGLVKQPTEGADSEL